ncbi:hypothetical protein [Photobacterium profundum]|uniref:Uncharacterized protein n=1 Tax=Photobacterium profundum (strain SS9) TaxID=298386 RepID=Q6LG07_PHOPR|nr:hypothetical protein [Photobacterium profundum]CAG23773.1 hypothetical protein PBPRB1926 [Photobacterium profundum SS9]
MYAKHRSYTLARPAHRHVRLSVNPSGFLSVEIEEDNNKLDSEFENLCFEKHGKITELVCFEHCKPQKSRWHIYLSDNDAKELNRLINDAKEEYEILMRDLC